MERPIHILFAGPRDRYGDLLRRLHGRYAVHQARDDAALIEFADQARAAGRPYDLAILGTDPPLLGDPAAVEQLRVIAPTTPTCCCCPRRGRSRRDRCRRAAGCWSSRWTPQAVMSAVADVLEERAAHVARLRSRWSPRWPG